MYHCPPQLHPDPWAVFAAAAVVVVLLLFAAVLTLAAAASVLLAAARSAKGNVTARDSRWTLRDIASNFWNLWRKGRHTEGLAGNRAC